MPVNYPNDVSDPVPTFLVGGDEVLQRPAKAPVTTTGRTLLAATDISTARAALQMGLPATELADRALTNTDNGATLICTNAIVLTVDAGLAQGFGCSIKGEVSFAGSATVNDVRTPGSAYPWCALVQIDVDIYDAVGGMA